MGARAERLLGSAPDPAVEVGFFLLSKFTSPDLEATGERAKNGHLGSP